MRVSWATSPPEGCTRSQGLKIGRQRVKRFGSFFEGSPLAPGTSRTWRITTWRVSFVPTAPERESRELIGRSDFTGWVGRERHRDPHGDAGQASGGVAGDLTWDQGNETTKHALFTLNDWDPGLLLRASVPVAAGLRSEHQRPAAPVPSQENRPVGPHYRGPPQGRRRAKQPVPQVLAWRSPAEVLASRVAMTA